MSLAALALHAGFSLHCIGHGMPGFGSQFVTDCSELAQSAPNEFDIKI